jgi:hypothetical protein
MELPMFQAPGVFTQSQTTFLFRAVQNQNEQISNTKTPSLVKILFINVQLL